MGSNRGRSIWSRYRIPFPIMSGMTVLQTLVEYGKLLFTWKAFAILMAVINIKNAPFAWHSAWINSVIQARVFYYMITRSNPRKHDLANQTKKELSDSGAESAISSHPIFTPVSMLSHTPMTEMDYNFHKSNSTYFSDLDISRTTLVTHLYTPGLQLVSRELDTHRNEMGNKKYPGVISVVLGSVYCSFKKAIIAYERYEMQSKVVGWDEKWLYVVTYFLRPEKKKGQGKTLLAVGISEYVTKKGRYTIAPARILAASGLIPQAPAAVSDATNGLSSAVDSPPAGGQIEMPGAQSIKQEVLEEQKMKNEEAVGSAPEWTWENIEKERLRGMDLVKQFVGLETRVVAEARL
ncbi:hypothetical protein KEM56_001339 [Ascosphaera pollenicola]|nr:hypothetical protein KEM56_001339 [Ascosphaera pollenicola]